jgi:hypothetical protein
MKNLYIIGTLLISLMMSSCKKDSGGTGDSGTTAGKYYVKFKADGTTYTYVGSAQGNYNKKDASSHYDFSIGARPDNTTAGAASIALGGVDADMLVTNKYYQNYGAKTDSTSKLLALVVGWVNPAGKTFLAYSKDLGADLIADSRIKFTEVTNTTLKGTFTGTLYMSADASSEKHTITNGEFYVQRVK